MEAPPVSFMLGASRKKRRRRGHGSDRLSSDNSTPRCVACQEPDPHLFPIPVAYTSRTDVGVCRKHYMWLRRHFGLEKGSSHSKCASGAIPPRCNRLLQSFTDHGVSFERHVGPTGAPSSEFTPPTTPSRSSQRLRRRTHVSADTALRRQEAKRRSEAAHQRADFVAEHAANGFHGTVAKTKLAAAQFLASGTFDDDDEDDDDEGSDSEMTSVATSALTGAVELSPEAMRAQPPLAVEGITPRHRLHWRPRPTAVPVVESAQAWEYDIDIDDTIGDVPIDDIVMGASPLSWDSPDDMYTRPHLDVASVTGSAISAMAPSVSASEVYSSFTPAAPAKWESAVDGSLELGDLDEAFAKGAWTSSGPMEPMDVDIDMDMDLSDTESVQLQAIF